LAASIGALGLVLLLARLAYGSLNGLLGSLVATMEALGNRQFEIAVPHTERSDQIGVMARAAEDFRSKLAEMEVLEADKKQAQARAESERKAMIDRLAGELDQAVGKIAASVSSASSELESAASTLMRTAESTQELSADAAGASKQASDNVNSVASSIVDVASSVGEISRQVEESRAIANEAVRQAQKADARVVELSHAADRIGDVVKLITAIAEQTNLLALNATIEAARAGEAGRGFGVVASEVKSLANQTAKATGEISDQIVAMQTATRESVAANKEIGATIERISQISSAIAAAVGEQGATQEEISRSVQQAAKGTSRVAVNVTEVSKGAAHTGATSAQVLSLARKLSSESNELKHTVDRFLETVRAA
jgi:methyl-accepting chemotaxis protein